MKSGYSKLLIAGITALTAGPFSPQDTAAAPGAGGTRAAVAVTTTRVLFPPRTMGKIFIANGAWDPMTLPPGGKFYAAARGPVPLRSDMSYVFEPNMMICEQPEFLLQFPTGSLQHLNLNKLEVNDKLLDVVAKLNSIRSLQIGECDLTDDKLKKLSNLANLEHLNMNGNLLTGKGLNDMTGCKSLVKIDMCFNALGRNFAANATHFPKLAALFACHAGVKDVDVESIAKIKTLEHVKLSSNFDVTNKGVKMLAALPKLRNVEIDCTKSDLDGLLALKGHNLTAIGLDKTWDNRTAKMKLAKAFPNARLHFRTTNGDVPLEVFEPLH